MLNLLPCLCFYNRHLYQSARRIKPPSFSFYNLQSGMRCGKETLKIVCWYANWTPQNIEKPKKSENSADKYKINHSLSKDVSWQAWKFRLNLSGPLTKRLAVVLSDYAKPVNYWSFWPTQNTEIISDWIKNTIVLKVTEFTSIHQTSNLVLSQVFNLSIFSTKFTSGLFGDMPGFMSLYCEWPLADYWTWHLS